MPEFKSRWITIDASGDEEAVFKRIVGHIGL